MAKAAKTFQEIAVRGYVMCHLSHSYPCGACLYFTFAFRPTDEARSLAQYDAIKKAIKQESLNRGGTLSHHHSVGVEHASWLSADISPAGAAILRSLFDSVDPGHNLNPGKIL